MFYGNYWNNYIIYERIIQMFFLDKKIEKATLNRTAFSILILSSSIFYDSFRCKNLELADGIYNKLTAQLIFAKTAAPPAQHFYMAFPVSLCRFLRYKPHETNSY